MNAAITTGAHFFLTNPGPPNEPSEKKFFFYYYFEREVRQTPFIRFCTLLGAPLSGQNRNHKDRGDLQCGCGNSCRNNLQATQSSERGGERFFFILFFLKTFSLPGVAAVSFQPRPETCWRSPSPGSFAPFWWRWNWVCEKDSLISSVCASYTRQWRGGDHS